MCGLDVQKRADRQRVKDFLVPHHPRAARFYLLPKINKPGNPGRAIVASNSALTENISSFADFYLRPSIIQLPSYVRDTTDFINKLRRLPRLPSCCLLVTLDISSLYTNISTRVMHHSLQGISKSSRDTGTSHGQSVPADPVSLIEELVCFQQYKLFTDSRHCHGNTYGAIIWKSVHGKARAKVLAYPRANYLECCVGIYSTDQMQGTCITWTRFERILHAFSAAGERVYRQQQMRLSLEANAFIASNEHVQCWEQTRLSLGTNAFIQ